MSSISKFFKNNIRQYGMVIALAFIMVLFQVTTGGIMFKPMNITNLVLQNSYVLILAIGMLLAIVTGNIDLSVGSVAAFVGAVSAVMMVDNHMGVAPAMVLSLLIGAAVGGFHGYFIAFLRIPAFIVTLAGMLIFRGLTMVILQGQTKAPFEKSFQAMAAGYLPGMDLRWHGLNIIAIAAGILLSVILVVAMLRARGTKMRYHFETMPLWLDILKIVVIVGAINLLTFELAAYNGIPIILIILSVLIVIYTFVTQRTIVGRHVYALGGNEKAARLSGVKTNQILFWVYVNMGVLSALAGLIVAGRLNAATPKAGTGFELDAIAACFIGGASASGGIGTVIGTIVGGFVMGVLNNGMSIMGVSVDWQQSIKGLVLLGAVWFDVYTKSRAQTK
ncbi:MAG: sugar ABC transporter permease [Treponema sp.]|nr:sugar ABC transporter permease [Treponema sp.]